MTERLRDQVEAWRERDLDATYFKANWGGRVAGVALLAAVGVDAEGPRERLAIEAAPGEQSDAWQGLLQGLVDRGLTGVELVISGDHERSRRRWMRSCPGWPGSSSARFQRNALAHVGTHARDEVAADLKEIKRRTRVVGASPASRAYWC